MPKPIFATLALVLAAWIGAAGATEPGTASGEVKLGDSATALAQAYAWRQRAIPEMRFGDSPERRIALLARPEENPNSFTVLGDGSDVVVENFRYEGGKLELASRCVKPLDLYDFSGSGGPSSFTFEATLEAPVEPAPALVATLEGEAASGSEQAAAVKALPEALEAEDAEKIRAAVLSDQPGSEMLATPEGIAQFKSMILGEGDAAAQMAKLAKVYVYETHSVVLFKEQEVGWSTMPVTEEDGRWKPGAP